MWDQFIVNPMLNGMLLLYDFLGDNLLLAIAVFTIIIRVITLPLNLRQQRSMMRTQELQPKIQAIQKKYKDNPQKMQEEFQKIGYNPAETLTGCLPLLIQMPILFGMFQVFQIMLGTTPQALFELTQRVYDSIDLAGILPIDNQFFIWNLGQPDPFLVLPVLVFATMFVQQKYLTPPKKEGKGKQDDPTAAMTRSMQYTMPIMFGFFSLQFQAGLSLYFVFSNILGIFQGLYMRRVMPPADSSQSALAATPETAVLEMEAADSAKEKTGPDGLHTAKPPTSKRKRRSAKR